MYPSKDQLWKKYPHLKLLNADYKRLCNNPTNHTEVVRAFDAYSHEYRQCRDRYQITPTEETPC
jgi:peptide methionine sulfoxide reductase MsrA